LDDELMSHGLILIVDADNAGLDSLGVGFDQVFNRPFWNPNP